MWTSAGILVIIFFIAAKAYEYVRARNTRKKEMQKYFKKRDGTVSPYEEE